MGRKTGGKTTLSFFFHTCCAETEKSQTEFLVILIVWFNKSVVSFLCLVCTRLHFQRKHVNNSIPLQNRATRYELQLRPLLDQTNDVQYYRTGVMNANG